MHCPICNHKKQQALLTLENYPIYQHPMEQPDKVPLPYYIDLQYFICEHCAHAFQGSYDREILEKIYSYHYYTPSPENIGAEFRSEFIDFINQENIIKNQSKQVFEIGCSSGDVLLVLKNNNEHCHFSAIEPNEETATTTRELGFTVANDFFTEQVAQTLNIKADIIYSRHVIEHVFDFIDFFNAIKQISNNESQLILETPSLDWSINHASTMPFHVEHVHVFSQRSLVTLANQFGWFESKSTVTKSGNLIILFNKINSEKTLPVIPNNHQLLQEKSKQLITELHHVCKNKAFVFWGAGSGLVTLLALAKLTPLAIVDGNPNKTGKRFCGLDYTIGYAPVEVAKLIAANKDINLVMVISSSFHQEISKVLNNLGWRGEVYSPYKP